MTQRREPYDFEQHQPAATPDRLGAGVPYPATPGAMHARYTGTRRALTRVLGELVRARAENERLQAANAALLADIDDYAGRLAAALEQRDAQREADAALAESWAGKYSTAIVRRTLYDFAAAIRAGGAE